MEPLRKLPNRKNWLSNLEMLLFEGGEGLRQTASHQGVSADGKSITVNVKGTDFQGKRRDAVAVYYKQ